MRVREYIREDGTNPYKKWFNCLDTQAAAKISVAKARLELGNTSNIKWFEGIGEYKIDWGPGYRIYLAQDGKSLIVLFGSGNKKKQQADKKKKKKLLREYKIRNKKR